MQTAAVVTPALQLVDTCGHELQNGFLDVDRLIGVNLRRVREAFATAQSNQNGAGEALTCSRTDVLDATMAAIMGTEAALVRLPLLSGAPQLLSISDACATITMACCIQLSCTHVLRATMPVACEVL